MLDPIRLYRTGRWCLDRRIPVIPRLMQALCQLVFHCVLPPEAILGRDTELGYRGLGIVIHKGAVLGSNVLVGPGVTIGGRSGLKELPIIGDNVFIGTGAKILGPITVGSGSVIGANAVVISDVPPCSVAAGVPAKIVRTGIDVHQLATLPRPPRPRGGEDRASEPRGSV